MKIQELKWKRWLGYYYIQVLKHGVVIADFESNVPNKCISIFYLFQQYQRTSKWAYVFPTKSLLQIDMYCNPTRFASKWRKIMFRTEELKN